MFSQSLSLIIVAFHTQMSFLRCIRNILVWSILAKVLEMGYVPNALGHFLVDAALNALLTSQAFKVPLPELVNDNEKEMVESIDTQVESSSAERSLTPTILLVPSDHIPDDLHSTVQLFDKLMASELNSIDVCSEDVLEMMQQERNNQRHVLANCTVVVTIHDNGGPV